MMQPGARILMTILSIFTIAMIGWLDILTGPYIGLSLFYLIPIIASGWWLGMDVAILNALIATGCWFAADLIPSRVEVTLAISMWNAMTRLFIFLIIGVLTSFLKRDRQRLQEVLCQEAVLARTDHLTGLPNHRAFIERLQSELALARRRGTPACVACMDLDNFKQVNDRYGHLAGDELLREVGRIITGTIRAGDFAGRMGGDEFAVYLQDVSVDEVLAISQRLADRIAAYSAQYPGTNFGESIGVAFIGSPPEDLNDLLREADAAAYEAKVSTQARVVIRTHISLASVVGGGAKLPNCGGEPGEGGRN